MIHTARQSSKNWYSCPLIIGLLEAMAVTLTYLRRNHVQHEWSGHHGVSQDAISRVINAPTLVIAGSPTVGCRLRKTSRPPGESSTEHCFRAAPARMHPSCAPVSTMRLAYMCR